LAIWRELILSLAMSKTFRDWNIDQPQLLPPSVHDFVSADHLARFVVRLVMEDLSYG
jgi:hypothetical protein